MKNTRKAAAVWLAMSLAISTAFGNTAWGEIRPDTGNNRCVHVHTAECYKDADETATPSQIGREPTECTHICSVESGCIRDTERENSEKADTLDAVASNTDKDDSKKEQAGEKAADRKDSSGNADENKNLNDVPTQNGAALSVSTPSNAKDTTTTGGTITPVPQTKILSWSWFDPEENLLDGRLELTGITEEAQPSFTEIIEYLPTAIIAQVGEGEDREEKNLLITNWSCEKYVQDEEGRWPLEGTYEFKAELPEGYELAEGVDALVVEVSVAGDQAVMLATMPLMTVMKDGTEKSIYWADNNYSGSYNELDSMGIRLSYANGYHYLTLNSVNMNSLYLGNWSNWVITLEGTNTLDVTSLTNKGTDALMIAEGTTVTIEGNGTLNAYGRHSGSGINLGGTLTIKSGTINASASKSLGGTDDGKVSGILIGTNGTLLVTGGDITASGTKAGRNTRYGMYVRGRFIMTGGKMEVIGNDCHGLYTMGQFKLSGGEMAVSSKADLLGFIANGDSTVITAPGKLTADILDVAPGKTVTVEKNATLTVDGVVLEKGSTLINNGNLTVNREVDDRDGGTLENNGTISGNGRIPDSAKQEPTKIADFKKNISAVYSKNTSINVQKLANIQKPANAGDLQYELVDYTGSESKGEGTIDGSTGLLTVKKAGVFKIKVKTLASGIYQEGTPVEITLTVDKADFPNTWTVNVYAVSGVYNGTEGYPAATITSTRIPEDAEYKYQLAATSNSSNLPDQWQSECPKIVNVNESGRYVFVKVITDNYKSKVFCSNNTTHITQRSFTESVEVAIDSSVYNNKPQNPKIKVLENWKGTLGSELTEGIDYEISFWKKEDNNQSVTKLEDAGTYIVYLLGKGNYDGSLKTAAFTINKCKLKAQITGDSFDKVYDGTTHITEKQRLAIQLCDDNHKTPELQDVRADQIDWAYQSADVGEHDIDATINSLAGDQAKNYELTEQTVSQKGTIKPRYFASMTVSADPLTYNGTEQQPKINASVETGLENVSPDAVFTYSKDGVNYQSEIPGFTEAGTYLVYVKASMANFNDETKTVAVTVQKAAAPTVSAMSESYSYKETGERQVALPGFPENCGTIGSITAQIVSDEGQILDSAAVDGMNLVLRLKGSSKNMVGKTAQVVVKVETKNYEDIQIPVIVTLTADSSDSNSNNNSGNNSGNNGSNNGNSNGSSSSDGDSSDYDDPNESSVKVTPDPSNKVTKDSQKGYRNVEQGVITGASNQTVNDGYSHWMKDAKGWWLRFSDGTWPMADRTGAYHWEKINGKWWAFDEMGYAKTGWLRDENYGGWFYMDPEHGMQTGWMLLNGVWYYFNPISDGKRGIMYAGQRTPDGYYVDKNGVWDGRNKQ